MWTQVLFGNPMSFHEPILWRHVSWEQESPERQVKEQSRWGWLFYRRVKTQQGVLSTDEPRRARSHQKHHAGDLIPTSRCSSVAGHGPTDDFDSCATSLESGPRRMWKPGKATPWLLKDLRKTVRPTTTSTSLNRQSRSSATPWRRNISSLRASGSAGIQGDHDNPATVRVWRTCERIRWRVSVLSTPLWTL